MKNLMRQLVLTGFAFFVIASCSSDDTLVVAAIPIPDLTNISPTSGPKETTVTINGKDLDANIGNTTVFFNDKEATIQSITNTKIEVLVPAKAFTGLVKVMIDNKELIGPEFEYIISDVQVGIFAGDIGAGDEVGTSEAAKFNLPAGMAFDSQNNAYIADAQNHKIRKITPDGMVSTFAGSTKGDTDGPGTSAQLNYPLDIVIDSKDNLYVSDRYNHKIKKITPSGDVSTLAGSTEGDLDGQGASAKFSEPFGLAIDLLDNIYVGSLGNHKIKMINANGDVSTIAGSSKGDLDGQDVNSQFNGPIGLVVDAENNIYVTDYYNHKIRKITSSGLVSTFVGSEKGYMDGQGSNAQFNAPRSIVIDNDGSFYVAEQSNYKIRKITDNGLVSTYAGNSYGFEDGNLTTANFGNLLMINIDANRDFYVMEATRHNIRKITRE